MARRPAGEGTVFARKDGWVVGEISVGPRGNRRKHRVYATSQRDAYRQLAQLRRELEAGAHAGSSQQTVGDFLRWWLEHEVEARVEAGELSDATLQSYRRYVERYIVPEIGRVRLGKLNAQQCQGVLRSKGLWGKAPATVNVCRKVLHAALDDAERLGLVVRNPAAHVEGPKMPRRRVEPVTVDDARAVLEAARGERLGGVYALGLAYGLRRSEALGPWWADVDFDAGMFRLGRAQKRVRREWVWEDRKNAPPDLWVPMPSFTVEALRVRRKARLEERVAYPQQEGWPDLVFSAESGRPVRFDELDVVHARVMAAAGVPYRRMHEVLRHGAATLLLELGVSERVVQELLGHSSIQVTADNYQHVGRGVLGDAMRRIDDALG